MTLISAANVTKVDAFASPILGLKRTFILMLSMMTKFSQSEQDLGILVNWCK
jgi:hypothetical protein